MKNDIVQKVFIGVIVALISVLGTMAMGAGNSISRSEAERSVAEAKSEAGRRADTLEVKLDAIQDSLWAMKVDMERQRTMLEDLIKRKVSQ